MLGNLTSHEIEQLLQSQILGRIGCHADGKTFVVPIAFAYDGKYLYGHSREGMKVEMMRRNPKVCFEVDKMENMANWQSVIVQGEYEELFGDAARKAMGFFMTKLKPHLASQTSVPKRGLAQFHNEEQSSISSIVFRIKVKEKSGKFEKTIKRSR
ncbi:MAG: pyridoxamine 5'-phosphate oxidase family protein [Bacteroidota bacterium]